MVVEKSSSVPSRKFFVGGNWKCNMRKNSIKRLISDFNNGPSLNNEAVETVIASPSVYLDYTRSTLRRDFETGLQNCWVSSGGPFTGEIDAVMAADIGSSWVLVGHPERRHTEGINESDEMVAKKAAYAVNEAGMKVVFYIGEVPAERDAGLTIHACEQQLQALAQEVSDWRNIVIAYEPVKRSKVEPWPAPDVVENVHRNIRDWISDNVSEVAGKETRITYAGGVTAENCNMLASYPNIDGFLVGSASMKPSFMKIVDSYRFST